MVMTMKKFKAGDRVIGNERNTTIQGRTGVVKYESGGMYWVVFEDTGEYSTGLYPWWLDPAPAKTNKK